MGLAAAAAAVIALISILFKSDISEPEMQVAEESEVATWEEIFETTSPGWSDIYKSPFDYPKYVWRAEIRDADSNTEPLDQFSDGDAIPMSALDVPSDFSYLLEPIALLPSGEEFGSRLY